MFNIGIMCQFNGSAWVCGPNTVDTDPYFNEVTLLWHTDDTTDVITGSGTWTINGASHPTVQTLVCKGADNGLGSDGYSELSFDVLADGRVSYVTFPGGTQASKVEITSTNSITYGEWLHFAIVQQGAVTSIYVGGALFAQGSIWRPAGPYWGLRIGSFCYPNFRNQSEAYFDEFRLTKNIARYTSGFTPLTQQFPYPTKSIMFKFHSNTFANTGTLSGVTTTQSVAGGSTSLSSNQLYNKWCIWQLNGTTSLAQASQPFDFGCDLEILDSTAFPFLSKTNAVNGGTTGWEIGFNGSRIPYYKDLSTNVVTTGVTAAPMTTRFSFRVISDGTTHVFYINSVVAGSVISATTSVQSTDLLIIDNSYFVGEFNMDNFFVA